jgi:SAM-dependent methyltransferase
MAPGSFQRSYVLASDDHFTSLAVEMRSRLQRRYRHGPDIEAALLMAVTEIGPRDVLAIDAGSGALAARIGRRIGAHVVATSANDALTGDAHARGVDVVVADVAALPFPVGALSCVVADRALQHERDVVDGLPEIRRVLREDGALLAVVRSNTCDGHELDELLDLDRRPRSDALSVENAHDVIGGHFQRVRQQVLDYTMEFPDGEAAAAYVATLPGRGAVAGRVARIPHPIQLTYGTALVIADQPHDAG